MILRRQGNKRRIADKITAYFPKHEIYLEPFFGAGGIFFNKPKVKTNIVNDLDSDVFNLFTVLMNDRAALAEMFYLTPIHSDLLKHWKANHETDPIKKAVRFLFLSNLTYLGAGDTLKYDVREDKKMFFSYLEETYRLIQDVKFMNFDFRHFFKAVGHCEPAKMFIYADPPYLNTEGNYYDQFKPGDTAELLDLMTATGARFALSEFKHPFIIDQATERGLNLFEITERQNPKNRRTEILITNYKPHVLTLNFNEDENTDHNPADIGI